MGRKSQRKGKTGENEFLQLLQDHGIEAQRNNQMYVGGVDNPDISAQIGSRAFHFEVKRTERLRLYEAVEQAHNDAQGHRIPVVAHRMNRRPWVIVLNFEDFLKIARGNEASLEDFDFSGLEHDLENMKLEELDFDAEEFVQE